MHRQRQGIRREARWLAAVAAVAGLAGCNPFRDVDASVPHVVRVMAYDNTNNHTNAPIVVEAPGAAATLADVPSVFGAIRVEFSKPLDGATIQKNAGELLCEAAANVRVTKDGADITPSASACYDPSGTNPSLTVIPEASPTCAGPDPNLPGLGGPKGLVPGSTYVIQATGVADRDGHKLSFTVTVSAAAFVASGATVGGAPLDGAADVAVGTLDEATGLYVTPSAALAASAAQPALAVLYGTPLDVRFTGGPMCPGSMATLCAGPFSLRTGADEIAASAVGDDADGLVQHVVAALPLESGRIYALDVGAGWSDFNSGNLTGAGFTSTFTTAASAPRVVWHWPLDGAAGAYATVDQGLVQQWTGQPMVGIAASTPLDGGGQLTLAKGGAAVAGVTQKPGETRNRSLTFEATADKLALENDAVYTVSWSGLAAGGAALQSPSGSFTFRTLPFGQDPRFPGFANFPVKYTTASVGARASYLRLAQGNVFPSLAGQPIAYFTTATGKIAYDAAAVVGTHDAPGRPEAFTFYALAGGGSVTLFEGAPAANVVVPGVGGYARIGKATPLEPWDAGDAGYPGSLLGFKPAQVLKANQLYTLVANVVPLGGAQTVQLTLPFTTAPFRVAAALDGSQVYDLSTSPVEATFGASAPLVLRTTGKVDPAFFGTTPSTDGPILLRKADGTKVAIHLADVGDGDPSRGKGQWIQVVPDAPISPSAKYTLVVTSALTSSRGEAIVPATYAFTTAPEVAGGAPVCGP